MSTVHAGFDGDCDVAALVYGPDEHPDALLAGFAADLRQSGVNVQGVLQARGSEAAGADGLVFFPDGRTLSIPRCGTRAHAAPDAWSGALHQAERFLIAAAQGRPDLLVLNRFGAAECSGGGLVPVICEAILRDIPVLLPVPAWRFGDWLDLSEGLTVKLACTRRSLDGWWQGLSRVPPPRRARTYCEQVK